MTKRRAMQVLIQHAARNCSGSGTGIRSLPSDADQREVAQAIYKLFPEAYGRRPYGSDLFNLGISRLFDPDTGQPD